MAGALRRLGNKAKKAGAYIALMPEHSVYFEPFCGTCSVFLAKQQTPFYTTHNYLNDLDDGVYDYWCLMQKETLRDELAAYISETPYHVKVWNDLKAQNPSELDLVRRVGRFLMLSSWGLYGMPNALRLTVGNSKKVLIEKIKNFNEGIETVQFDNTDFEKFLTQYSFKDSFNPRKVFAFDDPPYVGTTNNYDTPKWTIANLERLIQVQQERGILFMICEFDTPEVIELAGRYGLTVVEIGDRQNLRNRRMEIILVNYTTNAINRKLRGQSIKTEKYQDYIQGVLF